MTVLLAGFDGLDTERLSVQLREAGFSVVGASGRQSARTLAQGTSAGLVVVPEGSAGETAWSWILELLPNARVVSLAPTESSGDLIARLHQVAALVETDAIETPHNSEAPLTALPGLPMGQAPARTTGHAIAHTEANEPAAYPRKLPAQSGAPDLAAKLETVRFGDYHQILEIEPGATAYVIDEQHDHLLALYSPTGWPGPVSAADVPRLEEVQRGIAEAYEILGDAALRGLYDEAQEGANLSHSWATR